MLCDERQMNKERRQAECCVMAGENLEYLWNLCLPGHHCDPTTTAPPYLLQNSLVQHMYTHILYSWTDGKCNAHSLAKQML